MPEFRQSQIPLLFNPKSLNYSMILSHYPEMSRSSTWAHLLLCLALGDALSGEGLKQPRRAALPPRCIHTAQLTPQPAILTREDGKNGKLAALLKKRGVPTEELPCIAFERLPGCVELTDALQGGSFDWCVITSPESASVFLDSWRAVGSPQLHVASVGLGTADALSAAGLAPQFVPSKATAKTLAAELPIETSSQVASYLTCCAAPRITPPSGHGAARALAPTSAIPHRAGKHTRSPSAVPGVRNRERHAGGRARGAWCKHPQNRHVHHRACHLVRHGRGACPRS